MTFQIGEYPVPAHAAYIWAVGDQLFVGFPPAQGALKGHTIPFPMTERGIGALLAVMRKRGQSPDRRLGTKGEPVADDIENAVASDERYRAWLKQMAEDKAARRVEAAKAEAFLEGLGL